MLKHMRVFFILIEAEAENKYHLVREVEPDWTRMGGDMNTS